MSSILLETVATPRVLLAWVLLARYQVTVVSSYCGIKVLLI